MKKELIIGIVVGIIVFSAVFLFLIYFHKNVIDETNSKDICVNYENSEECSLNLECKWISNESKCALVNAIVNEEESYQKSEKLDLNNLSNSICNKLPLVKEWGSDDKYYCLAVVNNNPNFCENILNDTEEIDNIEELEGDLNDKTPYYLCLAISDKDSSYCKLVREEAKKTCYNVLAQTSGNINVCSDINYNSNDKQQCYFNFVNALYWEDKSEEITTDDCDKVGIDGSSQDKDTCLAFKERDVSLCGNNKNCLTFFYQEMSFCDGATSNFKDKGECIRDRAMVNEDISICETLSEQTRRDDCYGDFSSHIQPSITICNKIVDIQRKQGCYIDAAINLAK